MDTNTNDNSETSTSQTASSEGSSPTAAPKARQRKSGSKKTAKTKKTSGRKLVTATLERRKVRVQFRQGGKVVAESAVYNTGNTVEKIIAYARRQLGAKKIGEAKPVAQELGANGKTWVAAKA